MSTRTFVVAAIMVTACTAPKRKATIPDPQGESYEDYLADGKKPPPARNLGDGNPADVMVYHFIDVGQGTALLLEFPCGAVLIDTGGEINEEWDGKKALFDYLEAFFARRSDLARTFDLFVLTHSHIDHNRWAMDVLNNYPVRNVIDNGREGHAIGSKPQVAVHEWLRTLGTGVGHRTITTGEIDSAGLSGPIIDPIGSCAASSIDPDIRALWGQVTEDVDSFGHDPNNHSIVLRVDYGESSALLTADLEVLGIARMSKKFATNLALLDVDLYQVGHHGSRNATVGYFMKDMTPELAVIPCGPYERDQPWTARAFGHPNKQAIDHLIHRDYGVSGKRAPKEVWIGIKGAWKERKSVFERVTIDKALYAVGWDGTIRVRATATGRFEVETER